ncbi:MAG: efflux RND transporter periplasmic adaptor subunit [Xanthomonadales bacterium]|nr:efflux RND transporter periplasmic adaptor subunit [Xanthomonadales bacterium]
MRGGNLSFRIRAWCSLLLLLLASGLAAQETVSVSIQPLSEVLVDLERSASAEVLSLNRAVIAAEVVGVVQLIHADVGAEVKQGDLLMQIDPADYRLALQQAEAGLATSKAQKAQADVRLQRARQLIEGNYLSADDLLARETEAQVASSQILVQEAVVAIARRNLAKCRIVAPFNGVVSRRMAQAGGYVSLGTPLLEFSETDRFELDAEVPDELADSLGRAEKIEFHSRNESWPVELLRLSPVIETERRSRAARFRFIENAPAIGRSGEVFWRVSRGLLPANLLIRRNGLLGIFLAESGKARFTPLPNAQEGRPVPVQLSIDALIVVTGRDRLQDGDPIKQP